MTDDTPAQLPKLFTEKEVAEYLGCVSATLARKRRAGGIAHTRAGGNVRYTEAQILQYIEDQTSPATRQRRTVSATTGPPTPVNGLDRLDEQESLRRLLEKDRGKRRSRLPPPGR